MPSKKRSVIPYYIFVQLIVLSFLALSYFNINKEDKPEERHYEVVNLAQEQLERIDKISDGLLAMLAFEDADKLSAINMHNTMMDSWADNQVELKKLIDRSKIEKADRDAVNKMYETCDKFMASYKNAQTYVMQKSNVSRLADSFNTLIKKNEDGYIGKMNELIKIYQKAENDKLENQKRQNYMVFIIGIVFMGLNVLLFATPAKKIIFGSSNTASK